MSVSSRLLKSKKQDVLVFLFKGNGMNGLHCKNWRFFGDFFFLPSSPKLSCFFSFLFLFLSNIYSSVKIRK